MLSSNNDLESAMRKAANLAAKEAVESLLRTEVRTLLGYGKYALEGRNSGDSRNGSYERTVQTSVGPITVRVPRDRNGDYSPKALPRYQRRTGLVTSVILKLYSCGMTDEEAAQESSRCLRCDHFGYGNFKGGRVEKW